MAALFAGHLESSSLFVRIGSLILALFVAGLVRAGDGTHRALAAKYPADWILKALDSR
jgi:hypothetical protein